MPFDSTSLLAMAGVVLYVAYRWWRDARAGTPVSLPREAVPPVHRSSAVGKLHGSRALQLPPPRYEAHGVGRKELKIKRLLR